MATNTTTTISSVRTQLASWLGQTPRLQEYTASLMDIGCDTPEMLPFLTEEQLREAGVVPLHAQCIIAHAKATSVPSVGARAEASSEGSNESDLGARLADLRGLYEGLTRTGSSERVLSEVRGQIQQMETELQDMEKPGSRLKLFPDQRLGQGQFPVYAAIWTGRGDTLTVAAKRLPLDVDISREVAALIKCEHRNVVRYFALERDDNFQYLVMEKCEGNLSQMIQSGALQNKCDREQVCLQLCQAVAYVHSDAVSMAHRDIKPENVLYCSDGSVKLCDFGLAKATVNTAQAATQCGTLLWIAPELLEGGAHLSTLDIQATDIFSLGCVMFHVLTLGGHPFHPGTDIQKWGFLRKDLDISALALDVSASTLLMAMLGPHGRPTAAACCAHPLFWTAEKTVDLCHLLRESLQNRPALIKELEPRIAREVGLWEVVIGLNPPPGGEWGDAMMRSTPYERTPFEFLVFVRNISCHPGYVVKGGGKQKPPFASKHAMCVYFKDHFPQLALGLCIFVSLFLSDELAFESYCLPGAKTWGCVDQSVAERPSSGGVTAEPRWIVSCRAHFCVADIRTPGWSVELDATGWKGLKPAVEAIREATGQGKSPSRGKGVIKVLKSNLISLCDAGITLIIHVDQCDDLAVSVVCQLLQCLDCVTDRMDKAGEEYGSVGVFLPGWEQTSVMRGPSIEDPEEMVVMRVDVSCV